MAGNPPECIPIRFGPFELFVDSGELRKDGVRIKLSGQPIQVLSTLVAAPGRLVTREELQHQLWPGSSYGDFEKGLNAAVNRLRENLNDSAHVPKYVETIPGRGYRFIGELRRPLGAQELGRTTSHYPARRRPGFRLGGAVLVLFLASLSVGLYRFILPKPASLQKFEITRLTNGGKEVIAAISPDGRYVAFAEEELGTSDTHGHAKESLKVMQVAGAQVEILPPAEVHYRTLRFSHDGQFLYFTQTAAKDAYNVGILYKAPALGGTPRRLITNVDSTVSLSPDGKRLVFARNFDAKDESSLIVAKEDDSEEMPIAVRKVPDFFASPEWSPDGQTISAFYFSAKEKSASLVEVPAQGGRENQLTQHRWPVPAASSSWISDGSGLIINVQETVTGPRQLQYVSFANGKIRRITNDLNYYAGVSLTSDNSILATVQEDEFASLWVAPFSSPANAKPISTGWQIWAPTWTADGRIVYVHDEVTRKSLWVMNSDGSKSTKLPVDVGTFVWRPRVSPDLRSIVFGSNRSGEFQIWRMDLDGNDPLQLSKDENFFVADMDVSADWKWVVYGRRNGGQAELWKLPLQGGDPVRLAHQPAYGGRISISPDAKTVAYVYSDSKLKPPQGVALVALEGDPKIELLDIAADCLRWTPDSRFLLYSRTEAGVSNIWEQMLPDGTPKQLTHFTSETIRSFDLSNDGKQLVIDRMTTSKNVILIHDVK